MRTVDLLGAIAAVVGAIATIVAARRGKTGPTPMQRRRARRAARPEPRR